MEIQKHLYPLVDSLTTEELGVFVLFLHVKPNSSMRLIEKSGNCYLEVRLLHKNGSEEVIKAFANHSYKPLALQTDSFKVEVSDKFKNSMLDAFRKTVHEKFINFFHQTVRNIRWYKIQFLDK